MVELRRVIVPAFASEVAVSRETVNVEVLRTARNDPEAETYQFVARLVMDDGDAFVASLAERCVALEGEVEIPPLVWRLRKLGRPKQSRRPSRPSYGPRGRSNKWPRQNCRPLPARLRHRGKRTGYCGRRPGRGGRTSGRRDQAGGRAAQARFDAARATTEEAQAKAAQVSDELLRLHNTKLLRYTAPARRVYASLRRRIRPVP